LAKFETAAGATFGRPSVRSVALRPRGLASLADHGIVKIALLGKNSQTSAVQVEVRSATSGPVDTTISFTGVTTPRALGVVPDLNGNGTPELAVIGINASNGNVLVQLSTGPQN
jgi:hypothetical protein